MDGKVKKIKERIADELDLPKDIIIDIPKITVIGIGEILIENHKGIVAFDNEKIRVNSRLGIICIEGSDIEILFIGKSTITIGGRFKALNYEERR